ncbi:hypothetical protein BC629DRAFT_1202473 [Irpex lacteus]|nr:hypothetical protein BC629DRAFT_1202473 [Irpex lacteus]
MLSGLCSLLSRCIPQFRLVAYDWTDDLSAVFAPLRLSHKYELDEVHRRLSAFLQQRWPSQLSTWLKVSEHYRISAEPGSYTASPTRSREHLVRSVAEVIVLAETTDVPAILPAAYYNLRLWMHDSRPLADATGAQCAEWDLGSCLESLSSYQFFRIVQLNEWLKRVESEVIRKELAHRLIAQCNVASCCNARRAFWKEELAGLMRAGNQLYRDPLRGLDTLNKGIVKRVQGHTPPAIESACSIRMLQEVAAVAKYIWEEMPFVIGIKPRVVDDIYGYQRFL